MHYAPKMKKAVDPLPSLEQCGWSLVGLVWSGLGRIESEVQSFGVGISRQRCGLQTANCMEAEDRLDPPSRTYPHQALKSLRFRLCLPSGASSRSGIFGVNQSQGEGSVRPSRQDPLHYSLLRYSRGSSSR